MGLNFAFIKSLHQASPVAFGAIDLQRDEQLIYSSGHAEKLLGYSKKELIGHSKNNFKSLVHPDDHEVSENAYARIRKSDVGEIVESTFRVRHSEGHYVCLFVRDIVFERDGDKPLKFTTVVQDITHVMQLEQDLAKKVEVLKEVSYKNSHELRGPVANIIGLVDLLKKEHFRTEYNEKILRHLEDTVKKLDEVIHEINSISNS